MSSSSSSPAGPQAPFVGFNTGNALCIALNKPQNSAVKEFAKALFKQVSEASRAVRFEHFPPEERKFSDALASILTGNETCAAIALSGPDILVATNKGQHDKKVMYRHATVTVVRKKRTTLMLKYTYHLRSAEQESQHCLFFSYQLDTRRRKVASSLLSGAQTRLAHKRLLVFTFPEERVGIEARADRFELDVKYFNFYLAQKIGIALEFIQPTVVNFEPLKSRADKLFNSLFVISKAFLDVKNCFENLELKQIALIKEKYKDYQKIQRKGKQNRFVNFLDLTQNILIEGFVKLFINEERNEAFETAARAYYIKKEVLATINSHDQWVEILKDSLTYELSKIHEFSQISDAEKAVSLERLYIDLVADYIRYKALNRSKTSVNSVETWFESVATSPKVSLPPFIEAKFGLFCKIAGPYFSYLAFIERHMKDEAKRGGAPANRIAKEHTYDGTSRFLIIEGEERVHAEMRLFSHHLLKGNLAQESYYGVSMLCCALCNYTLSQFRKKGLPVPETSGTHATLFSWPLPEVLREDEYMKIFLGEDLFRQYKNLPPVLNLGGAKASDFCNSKEVCVAIIEALDKLNSTKNLKSLGLDAGYIIADKKNLRLDNKLLRELPAGHVDASFERMLKDLEAKYTPVLDVAYFQPVLRLGLAWEKMRDDEVAFHYLDRAGKILDEYPDGIPEAEPGTLFNRLGNLYRRLGNFEKALEYLTKALNFYESPHDAMAEIFKDIGCLHIEEGLWDKARSAFQRAIDSSVTDGMKLLIQQKLDTIPCSSPD